jgi:hypothetical protein
MKPIYRLTYLLLSGIGALLIIPMAITGKLTWIFRGKNPAMKWFDWYNARLDVWKKGKGVL